MSLMMTGMVGGLGKAALDQSAHLKQQEDADADMTRRKSLESWLMQTRNEYQIESEKRAEGREIAKERRTDQREIEKDERTWKNEQDRAQTKRDIKAADKTSELYTELDFKTKNRDAISANTKVDAEAKETDADRRLKGAQAENYEANADYTRGAKTAAAAGGGEGKLTPVDKDELDFLQTDIRGMEKEIRELRRNGAWLNDEQKKKLRLDPKTAETVKSQEEMESQLVAKKLRAASILLNARGVNGRPDPLGKRGVDAPAAAPQSIMQSPRSAEPSADPKAAASAGADFRDPGLRAAIDDIKDPQERANARQALGSGVPPGHPQSQTARQSQTMQATMERVSGGNAPTAQAPQPGQQTMVAQATGEKPVRQPSEDFSAFRVRFLKWAVQKQADDDAAATKNAAAASEVERQRRLQERGGQIQFNRM